MKFRTTKKAINEGYYYILSAGYCDMQTLLKYQNPIAYSTRAEGWACDYYDFDGVCICTGYAPITSKHTKADYKTICEYEKRALQIDCNINDYYERKQKIEELLTEFIREAKQ